MICAICLWSPLKAVLISSKAGDPRVPVTHPPQKQMAPVDPPWRGLGEHFWEPYLLSWPVFYYLPRGKVLPVLHSQVYKTT
jgi:hypothetical protein